MHMRDYIFNSSFGIKINAEQVVQAILDFMLLDERRAYKVIIGTDSDVNQAGVTDFVTAVVVHRVGNGGRYFWRRIEIREKFHTLRDRILNEVMISLDVAKDFLETAKNFKMPHFDFEIHVDIGEKGATRVMIQELVGMIRANNFEAKTKPESYAASKVADRHT